MLEVERKTHKQLGMTEEEKDVFKNKDIIITRIETVIENDGETETRKRVKNYINLTKKINESKKLIKNYTAEEKIAELEKIFTTK